MQIFGDSNITHLQDTAWVDPGAEAHDEEMVISHPT